MGGNVVVINRDGDEVCPDDLDIRDIDGGSSGLRSAITVLLEEIDDVMFNRFGYYLWNKPNQYWTGRYLNGSSVLVATLGNCVLQEIKPTFGDIDVMVPEEAKEDLWSILNSSNFDSFQGSNKPTVESIGNQINTIFKLGLLNTNLNAQIDFEFVPFVDGFPTEWSKFSHSSNIEDIKLGIKGVHHKFLIRSLVGAMSKDDSVIVCTPKSTSSNITISKSKIHQNPRLKKFSVETGIRDAYEPLLSGCEFIYIDKKKVIRPLDTGESVFITVPSEMAECIFKTRLTSEALTQFESFVGIVRLMKEFLSDSEITETIQRYTDLLWGTENDRAQELERDNPVKDLLVKMRGYDYIIGEFSYLCENNKYSYLEKYYSTYGQRHRRIYKG